MGTITANEFRTRLGELCVMSGLSGVPRKPRDRHILLKSVTLTLDPAKQYSESDINDRLIFWLTDIAPSVRLDHVSLRRWLVDEAYLGRDPSGRSYRVRPAGPDDAMFEREVEDVEVYETIGLTRKRLQEKKRERLNPRAVAP
jgi:hypothetical protein